MNKNNKSVVLSELGFKEKLVIYRHHYGITAKFISEKLGVSESYLSYLEAGIRKPNRAMIHKLVQVLFPEGNPLLLDEWLVDHQFLPTRVWHVSDDYSLVSAAKQAWYEQPRHLSTNLNYIWALLTENQNVWAKQQIQGCIQYFTEPVYDKWLLGLFELTHGHCDTAIAQMELALQVCPTKGNISLEHPYPQLLRSLGKTCVQRTGPWLNIPQNERLSEDVASNFTQALSYLTQAVKLCDAPILRQERLQVAYLCALYTSQLRWPELIQDLRQCLADWPEYSNREPGIGALDLAILLGKSYAWNHQITEAEDALNLLRICHPQYWRVYHALAGIFCLKQVATKEEHWLQQALDALHKMVDYLPEWESLPRVLSHPALEALREKQPALVQKLSHYQAAEVKRK